MGLNYTCITRFSLMIIWHWSWCELERSSDDSGPLEVHTELHVWGVKTYVSQWFSFSHVPNNHNYWVTNVKLKLWLSKRSNYSGRRDLWSFISQFCSCTEWPRKWLHLYKAKYPMLQWCPRGPHFTLFHSTMILYNWNIWFYNWFNMEREFFL